MLRWLILLTLFFSVVSAAGKVDAEFYKYTDDTGQVHFVDDTTKIPEGAGNNLETYKERYDHLPAAEQERIHAEQEIQDAKKEEASRQRFLQIMESARKEREAYLAGKRPSVNETPFILKNNQVLVPVKIGYDGREIETVLLLDTGAGITALHGRVATSLNIRSFRKTKARMADGQLIDTRLARVGYIQVGPHRIDRFNAAILDFEGGAADHNGLLGMDFLGRFPYGIDMVNRVIRWTHR